MFIEVLSIIYSILVVGLFILYLTNRRERLIHWAQKHGKQNNFFIRMIRKRPKKKKEEKDFSKAFTDQMRSK